MSESVQLALVAILMLVVKQCLEWVSAWLIARSLGAKVESAAKKTNAKMDEINANVATIEKATNSMKDALVQATGDKRFLEGQESQRNKPKPSGEDDAAAASL